MTELDVRMVLAFAENNMRVSHTARKTFYHHNTVDYHLGKVKQETGLDPHNFYDLGKLVKMLGSNNH